MKVFFGNAIEAPQMTLRLVPEFLDAVDMVSGFNKLLRETNAVMSELWDIQSIKSQKTISIDNAVWLDSLSNDWKPLILLSIRKDNDVELSLSETAEKILAHRTTSAFPFRCSRKFSNVDLNLSGALRHCLDEI